MCRQPNMHQKEETCLVKKEKNPIIRALLVWTGQPFKKGKMNENIPLSCKTKDYIRKEALFRISIV